jgi:pimeloyl-ACP methyl ester carboxylesterase
MASLADIRTIYAPDLPGFGDSPPDGISSATRLAELMMAFADTLGLDRFDVNGHSFGAAVAATMAAHWPQRVGRVVLSSLSAPRNSIERLLFAQAHVQWRLSAEVWRPWLAAYQPCYEVWQPLLAATLSTPPLAQMVAARFFYELPGDKRLLNAGLVDFVRMDPRAALDSAASAGNPLLLEAFERIGMRTLVVSGREDLIMPASAVEALARMVPNCQLAWIERCGHVPMIERPDEYHQALRDFLA